MWLAGVTRRERHAVLRAIEDALAACGGWLVDFNLLSNIEAVLHFEAPGARLGELAAGIDAAGVRLDEASRAAIAPRDGAVAGALRVTFVHDDPPLRRTVPSVPG